jgi:hypothetical protein
MKNKEVKKYKREKIKIKTQTTLLMFLMNLMNRGNLPTLLMFLINLSSRGKLSTFLMFLLNLSSRGNLCTNPPEIV